jgi:hypothetical protein
VEKGLLMPNIKISELPAASAASTSQEFEVNDSGTSKKVTGSQIKTFVKDGLLVSDVTDLTATAAELNQLDTNTFTFDITIPDKIVHAGDTNTSIRFPADDTVTVETNGSERLRVTSAGNVGIGTSSPAEQLHITGNFRVGSAVLATPTGSAPMYVGRAWVNFNGTGTVAIRSSGNVSSITDNGTGDYTVNFTTAMPDANYAVTTAQSRLNTTSSNIAIRVRDPADQLTSSVRVQSQSSTGGFTDADAVYVAIFR